MSLSYIIAALLTLVAGLAAVWSLCKFIWVGPVVKSNSRTDERLANTPHLIMTIILWPLTIGSAILMFGQIGETYWLVLPGIIATSVIASMGLILPFVVLHQRHAQRGY